MRLWFSRKFRKDFYKYYNEYRDKGLLADEKEFVMAYEKQDIEIKETIKNIYGLISILSICTMFIFLVYGIPKLPIVSAIVFSVFIILYEIQSNKIKLAHMSRDLTNVTYTKLIKEKYNLS